ncbi:Tn3 family transposase [Sphaerisporangium sp. NBC_01403]|uniref:Tn3 family transposase n=1 Tax=Sphaerisporangium sp. NBC_01403 TaxID=2903599 RepID=UPI003865AB97
MPCSLRRAPTESHRRDDHGGREARPHVGAFPRRFQRPSRAAAPGHERSEHEDCRARLSLRASAGFGEGLNVVKNWNSANRDIFCGKAGEPTGDGREHVEVSALALHLVQAAIAYLNTVMIQIGADRTPRPRCRLGRASRPLF